MSSLITAWYYDGRQTLKNVLDQSHYWPCHTAQPLTEADIWSLICWGYIIATADRALLRGSAGMSVVYSHMCHPWQCHHFLKWFKTCNLWLPSSVTQVLGGNCWEDCHLLAFKVIGIQFGLLVSLFLFILFGFTSVKNVHFLIRGCLIALLFGNQSFLDDHMSVLHILCVRKEGGAAAECLYSPV